MQPLHDLGPLTPSVTLVPSLGIWAMLEIKHSSKSFIPQLPRPRLQCPDSLPLLTPIMPQGKQTGEHFWTDTRRLCCGSWTQQGKPATGSRHTSPWDSQCTPLWGGKKWDSTGSSSSHIIPKWGHLELSHGQDWEAVKDKAVPYICQVALAKRPTTGPFS